MIKKLEFLLLILVALLLVSCGNTGANGVGTTVKITASIKSATSISTALAVGTPASFGSAQLSYDFLSTILPHPNGIPASNVTMTTANISYIPLTDNSGNLPPQLPSFTKGIGLSVPGGGTGSIDNMIVTSPTVMQYLYDNFVAPATGLLNVPGMQFNYLVIVEFSGYEVNSGAAIKCDQTIGNLFITK